MKELKSLKSYGESENITRVCYLCLKRLPATREFFAYSSKSADKCKRRCKKCAEIVRGGSPQESKERIHDITVVKRVEQIEKCASKALTALVNTRSASKIPHVAEIFEKLITLFGGSEGYAEKFYNDYEAAEEGSIARVQLHKLVNSYSSKTSEMGAAKIPVEMMGEEELDAEMKRYEIQRIRMALRSGEYQAAAFNEEEEAEVEVEAEIEKERDA